MCSLITHDLRLSVIISVHVVQTSSARTTCSHDGAYPPLQLTESGLSQFSTDDIAQMTSRAVQEFLNQLLAKVRNFAVEFSAYLM